MLDKFPELVLDSFLSIYVSSNDLRSIHQVSTSWKFLIDSRQLINNKRLALVEKIRENKENIQRSTQPLVFPATAHNLVDSSKRRLNGEEQTIDGKDNSGKSVCSGGRVFRQINSAGNTLLKTPASSSPSRRSSRRNSSSRISSTPKSRFQRRYEAGLKLMKGQILFSCPGCRSPVPSPVTSNPSTNASSNTKDHLSTSRLNESTDSGYSVVTPNSDTATKTPQQFEFKTPSEELTGSHTDTINLSVIVSPSFSPASEIHDSTSVVPLELDSNVTVPSPEEIKNEDKSSSAMVSSLEFDLMSTCFIDSTSALSISDSDSKNEGTSQNIQINSQKRERNESESSTEGKHTSSVEDCSAISDDTGIGSYVGEDCSVCSHCETESKPSKIKLRRSGSPSVLPVAIIANVKDCISKEANNNNKQEAVTEQVPVTPVVVQCPECSYRFCSRCEFREHPGLPCRLIGETMEEEDEEFESIIPVSNQLRPLPSLNSTKVRVRTNGKNSGANSGFKVKSRKSSLRRLVCL